ncbi:MAG: Fe-S protein assembly co-chaperone HscB [Magnetococcus sp. MYC-9]
MSRSQSEKGVENLDSAVVAGRSCWSCRGPVGGFAFCPTCQAIQPPDLNLDYFQLFDLPVGFTVIAERLEILYQKLQKLFHPDRYAARGATERRLSLEHVTRLNRAYQTLRDPLLRSEYLLGMLGHPSSSGGQGEPPDPSLLMEVMEQREALEAVDLASRGAVDQLASLRGQAERCLQQDEETLAHLFVRGLSAGDAVVWSQIAQTNHHLRYHRRFMEALEAAEEKIFAGEV